MVDKMVHICEDGDLCNCILSASEVNLKTLNNQDEHHQSDLNEHHQSDLNENHKCDLNEHHKGDLNEQHQSDLNEHHKGDLNEQHQSDLNEYHKCDLNEHHKGDLNEQNQSDLKEHHKGDLNEPHQSDLKEHHKGDLNEHHQSDLNEHHKGDLNEHHKGDLNEQNQSDLNENHKGDLNEPHQSDLNEHHKGDLNEQHQSDLNEHHKGDLNEHHKGDLNEHHKGDLNEHHKGDLNEQHQSDLNEHHKGDLNEHHKGDLNEQNQSDLNEHHKGDLNEQNQSDMITPHQGPVDDFDTESKMDSYPTDSDINIEMINSVGLKDQVTHVSESRSQTNRLVGLNTCSGNEDAELHMDMTDCDPSDSGINVEMINCVGLKDKVTCDRESRSQTTSLVAPNTCSGNEDHDQSCPCATQLHMDMTDCDPSDSDINVEMSDLVRLRDQVACVSNSRRKLRSQTNRVTRSQTSNVVAPNTCTENEDADQHMDVTDTKEEIGYECKTDCARSDSDINIEMSDYVGTKNQDICVRDSRRNLRSQANKAPKTFTEDGELHMDVTDTKEKKGSECKTDCEPSGSGINGEIQDFVGLKDQATCIRNSKRKLRSKDLVGSDSSVTHCTRKRKNDLQKNSVGDVPRNKSRRRSDKITVENESSTDNYNYPLSNQRQPGEKAENLMASHELIKEDTNKCDHTNKYAGNRKNGFSERLNLTCSGFDDVETTQSNRNDDEQSSEEHLPDKDSVPPNVPKTDLRGGNSVRLKNKKRNIKGKKSINKKNSYLKNLSENRASKVKQSSDNKVPKSKITDEKLKSEIEQMRCKNTQAMDKDKEIDDKFERLKQSLSDLDGFGLDSQQRKKIDNFMDTLNELETKLKETETKPYKPLLKNPTAKVKKCKTKTAMGNTKKADKTTKNSKVKSKETHTKEATTSQSKEIPKKSLITSTPKLKSVKRRGRCKKRKSDKAPSKVPGKEMKQGIPDQQEQASLDFSLPTPTVENANPFLWSRRSSDSVSFDSNLAKDMCDSDESDEELPVGLSPIQCDKTFSEKDIVWVKWKKWPYLPAMIRKVCPKKKRVACQFFSMSEKPEKPLYLSTIGKKVLPYFDDTKREEIMKASEALDPDMKTFFNDAMKSLDIFLTKKALGQIKDDFSFFEEEDDEDLDGVGETEEKITQEDRKEEENTESDASVIITRSTRPKGLSKKGELRKVKMREKAQKFIELLKTEECKNYLQGLFLEKTKSELHTIFMTGTVKEKAKIKHQGFGPIDDEDQIMNVLWMFHAWLQEVNKSEYLNITDYIMDVWIPEGIVFVYQKFYRYTKKKAWEMFRKGPRRTKEEVQLMHNMIIEQANNISPEDKQRLQEKYEEREAQFLRDAEMDYKPKKLFLG